MATYCGVDGLFTNGLVNPISGGASPEVRARAQPRCLDVTSK